MMIRNQIHVIIVSLILVVTNNSSARPNKMEPTILFSRNGDGKIVSALSFKGTRPEDTWRINQLAPRGSASITSAGALQDRGIKYIIHAAPGSMASFDSSTEPSLDSIRLAIANSMRLVNEFKIDRVAIPLIGGGIFITRMNISKEKLAFEIIDAAMRQETKAEIVFVAYDDADNQVMNQAFEQSKADLVAKLEKQGAFRTWLSKLWNWFSQSYSPTSPEFFKRSKIVQGSITDFGAHSAEAIVNAANMELQFGGGLSGAIGRATHDESNIDQMNQRLIHEYYHRR